MEAMYLASLSSNVRSAQRVALAPLSRIHSGRQRTLSRAVAPPVQSCGKPSQRFLQANSKCQSLLECKRSQPDFCSMNDQATGWPRPPWSLCRFLINGTMLWNVTSPSWGVVTFANMVLVMKYLCDN